MERFGEGMTCGRGLVASKRPFLLYDWSEIWVLVPKVPGKGEKP